MNRPVEIVKVDKRLGIAVGWALITATDDGSGAGLQPYYDLHGDHCPDDVAEAAFAKFAEGDRVMLFNHDASQGIKGRCLWIFPLSATIAKSLNITTQTTGVLIGVKPDDPALLDEFGKSIHGFSIGGRGHVTEETSP